MLRAFSRLSKKVKIDKKACRNLFLFIWNLFALWYQRGRPLLADRFEDLQPTDTWSRFAKVVEDRAPRPGTNDDKLDTLALAGALAFVLPDFRSRMREAIGRKIKGVPRLMEEAADEKRTFIPAFFAYQGLALIEPDIQVFTPGRVWSLLKNGDAYDDRGLAIEYVCDWLRGRLTSQSSGSWSLGRTRRLPRR